MVRTSRSNAIQAEFGLKLGSDPVPRYNLCPGEDLLAIIRDADTPRFCSLRWGLVPSFATDPSSGRRAINARAETVAVRPAFRDAFGHRRCLIVADGFYEWRREERARVPHFIHLRSNRPFAFAGLWDRWAGGAEPPLWTCTVLTCPPNDLLAPIHDRMPVILPPSVRMRWLEPADGNTRSLASLLRPYPDDELEAYPVSRLVNAPRNDVPECLARVPAAG